MVDPHHAKDLSSEDSETDDSNSDDFDKDLAKKEKIELAITKMLTGYKEDDEI